MDAVRAGGKFTLRPARFGACRVRHRRHGRGLHAGQRGARPAEHGRATHRLASDRAGGAGGWDLWQAELRGGRWQDPQPLSINTAQDDTTPLFSADGRWLLFASTRPGVAGGSDLYRASVDAQGAIGVVQCLGPAINSSGNERVQTLLLDGTRLLFASDGHGGVGGMDLFVAR